MNDINATILKAKNGDAEAFSLIYKDYYVPIYRYVHLRVRNRETAEDLTQDIFLKIYKAIDSITSTGSPLSYFYTVARNTLIDFWRKKNIDTVGDDDYLSEVPDPTPDPMDQAGTKEQSLLLYDCIDKLTPDQREVITLKFINDLSTEEIANLTGKKETAIRQLQVRGLRALTKIFKQKYG